MYLHAADVLQRHRQFHTERLRHHRDPRLVHERTRVHERNTERHLARRLLSGAPVYAVHERAHWLGDAAGHYDLLLYAVVWPRQKLCFSFTNERNRGRLRIPVNLFTVIVESDVQFGISTCHGSSRLPRSRRDPIIMVEASEHGDRDDSARTGERNGVARNGDPLAEPLVRPRCVEVAEGVLSQHVQQVSLLATSENCDVMPQG